VPLHYYTTTASAAVLVFGPPRLVYRTAHDQPGIIPINIPPQPGIESGPLCRQAIESFRCCVPLYGTGILAIPPTD